MQPITLSTPYQGEVIRPNIKSSVSISPNVFRLKLMGGLSLCTLDYKPPASVMWSISGEPITLMPTLNHRLAFELLYNLLN